MASLPRVWCMLMSWGHRNDRSPFAVLHLPHSSRLIPPDLRPSLCVSDELRTPADDPCRLDLPWTLGAVIQAEVSRCRSALVHSKRLTGSKESGSRVPGRGVKAALPAAQSAKDGKAE